MTKDDIMEMAEQAGLLGPSSRVGNSHEAAERFANLVAAAEREACAVACDEQGYFSAGLCAAKIRARSQS
jgi:hypothetical protein